MSQEFVFFLSFAAMGIAAFVISAICEFVFLKKTGWIENTQIAAYVAGSNILALLICYGFFGVLTGLFLLFFSATLGGVLWVSLVSVALAIIAFISVPLLMIGGRQIMRKIAGISPDSLTWKYSAGASIVDAVFVMVFVAAVMATLTGVGQIIGN